MKRYNTYKDSGADWIGDIPESWNIVKIKFITDIYSGNSLNSDLKEVFQSENEEDLPYVSTKDIDIDNNTLNYDNGLKIPLEDSFYKVAPRGSFLLCIEGANAGKKLAFVEQDCCFVNKLACFNFPNKFLFYYSQSHPFKTQFFNSISGLIGGVSISVLKEFISTIPSPKEQTQIANYLDYKTGLIDNIIAQKEELIQKLKEQRQAIINEAVTKGLNPNAILKDSGIEWLGEIPEHWVVPKLKFLTLQIIDGAHFTPTYVEKGIPFLRVTDIQSEKINLDKVKFIPESEHLDLIKRCNPERGDILLSKNGTIGITKVIDWDWEFSIFVSLCLIKFNKKLTARYFSHFFNSSIVDQQIKMSSKTTSVTNLHLEKIKELLIAIPTDTNEQIAISDYLDQKLSEFDLILDETFNSIEKLKEYRQSLISEAVTGKIDVRDWQVPNN